MNVSRNSGPGKALQEAREANNISMQEVANRLKLSEAVVSAIEANDVESLPAPAYVRGYLRAYAALLDLDPDSIVSQFQRLLPDDPELVNIYPARPQKQGTDPMMLWVTAGIVIALLVLFILWAGNWYKSYLQESKVTVAQSQVPATQRDHDAASFDEGEVSEPVLEADQSLPEETSEERDGLEAVDRARSPLPAAFEEANAAEDSTDIAAQILEQNDPSDAEIDVIEQDLNTRPTAPTGTDVIKLQASGQSWVYITDANGYRLIYRLLDKNESSQLRGQAPFDVVLGVSPNISIDINGQEYDHSVFTRANLSARFILPAPE